MNKKVILFFSSLLVTANLWAQTGPIRAGADGKSWDLQTKSSLYQIKVVEDGSVNAFYFGDKAQGSTPIKQSLGQEVTVRGGHVKYTPMLEVVFPDQVRDLELVYNRAEIVTQDGYDVLKIEQKDKFYPITVTGYIRILPEYDLIEKWIEVKNTGKKGAIKIENLQSGNIFLPKDQYEMTHLSGIWGAEYQPQTTRLTQGVKTLQIKDFRSFGSSFFAIRQEGETSETCGKVWFGTLQYSGNWRMDFEKQSTGEVQVVGGINFWDQSMSLKAGEGFTSPKIIFGYTEQGMQGVSQNLAAYTREKVMPIGHRNQVRPVLYNSWYATTFHVNEEHQLALAKEAKELGVEMFVIDDGWFKGRVDDRAGLGDWTVDKNKFPNGLKPMIDKINAMGLDFGIWVEPEMVNPNSDLYRAHPDWVFNFPNRQRIEGRSQLILNLAREDVYEYLHTAFSNLLKENNIKFIKWDMNRALATPGFPSASIDDQRAVRIKYVENLYRLIESLRKQFPDVWFENCASGGGRVDLGMMARTDFSWASDNTDPVERTFIQYSFLNAFPANSMICWVTQEDWHRQNHPLEFKFDVSMCGVLGVGYDITKWTDKEKSVAKEKIARYKEIRETVQFGDLYRLISPFESNRSVLQYVNKNGKEAIIFAYNLAEYPNTAIPETKRPKTVKLRGLQSDAQYKIEGIDGSFSGDMLMNIGIELPLRGAFKSAILKVTKQ